jgi:hypothetical protein
MPNKNPIRNIMLTLAFCLLGLASSSEIHAADPPFPEAALPAETILAPAASSVENFSWKVGRAVLRLKQGTIAEIRQGERVVGFFLKGSGSLDYTSGYATEFPVMAFNQKQQKGPELRGSGASRELTVSWDEAAIFTAGINFPELPKPTVAAGTEAYRKHREFFDIQDQDPLGHRLAWRALNRSEGGLAQIEMKRAERGFVYELDNARSHVESLVSVTPDAFGSIKWMKEYTISRQPAEGRNSLRVPTPMVLTHLDVDLHASNNHQAGLTVQEDIRLVEPARLLLFDMITNRVDESAMGNAIRRPVEVKSVTTGEGVALPYDHRNNQLAVLLPKTMEAGQSLKLKFRIEGGLLTRHGSDDYWELGIFPWFPQPPLEGQNYTLHATVRVPKPFVVLMSGDTVRRTEEKGDNILETRLDKPICFFSMAAGKYTIKEFVKDGITVRLAGYAGLGASAERLAKTAHGIIGFYQTILGRFPVKELNLVERTELGHGQAPPGMVWITSEAFDPIGDDVNRFYAAAWINQGIAHEIAHQYWGTQVKMATYEDQWITESFAEYSSALAMIAMKGKGEEKYRQIVHRWQERARIAQNASTIPMANRLAPGPMASEEHRYRQDLVYFKGAAILHSLHCEIGEAAFKKWFWLLQSNLEGKAIETAEILPILQYVSKRDFAPLLEKCFWGTELPTFPKDPIPHR